MRICVDRYRLVVNCSEDSFWLCVFVLFAGSLYLSMHKKWGHKTNNQGSWEQNHHGEVYARRMIWNFKNVGELVPHVQEINLFLSQHEWTLSKRKHFMAPLYLVTFMNVFRNGLLDKLLGEDLLLCLDWLHSVMIWSHYLTIYLSTSVPQ